MVFESRFSIHRSLSPSSLAQLPRGTPVKHNMSPPHLVFRVAAAVLAFTILSKLDRYVDSAHRRIHTIEVCLGRPLHWTDVLRNSSNEHQIEDVAGIRLYLVGSISVILLMTLWKAFRSDPDCLMYEHAYSKHAKGTLKERMDYMDGFARRRVQVQDVGFRGYAGIYCAFVRILLFCLSMSRGPSTTEVWVCMHLLDAMICAFTLVSKTLVLQFVVRASIMVYLAVTSCFGFADPWCLASVLFTFIICPIIEMWLRTMGAFQTSCRICNPAGAGSTSYITSEPCAKHQGTDCRHCWQDWEEGDKVSILRCQHVFHEACLSQWFSGSGQLECPICHTTTD